MKKKDRPFWETGLNPITMTKFESYDKVRWVDQTKEYKEDAKSELP